MKNLIVFTLTMLITAVSFAADLTGTYNCTDGETLHLSPKGIRTYNATLRWEAGETIKVYELSFPGESLKGTLYEEDGTEAATVISGDGGNRLSLKLNPGWLTCTKVSND